MSSDYSRSQRERGTGSDTSDPSSFEQDPSLSQSQYGQGQYGQGQYGQGQYGQGGQHGQDQGGQHGQGQGGQHGQGQGGQYGQGQQGDTSGQPGYDKTTGQSGGSYGSGLQGSRYDDPSTGTGTGTGSYETSAQQHQTKPGIGQRMMGRAEKAFGKMTGDSERSQKGQERQTDQNF